MKTTVLTPSVRGALKKTVLDMLVEFQAHSEGEATGAKVDPAAARAAAESFLKRLLNQTNGSHLMVALDGAGRGVGFILFTVCAGYGSNWIWLCEIFTRKKSRHKGVGSRLCYEIGEWGRAHGMKSIVAMTGEENVGVHKLCREYGMKAKPKQAWLSLDL